MSYISIDTDDGWSEEVAEQLNINAFKVGVFNLNMKCILLSVSLDLFH